MSALAHLEWQHVSQVRAPYLAAHHYMPLLCFYLGGAFKDPETLRRYHEQNVYCTAETHFACKCPAPLTWRLSGF